MIFDIVALGDFYADIEPAAELESGSEQRVSSLQDLREEIKPLCRERFRRINRFIQLCLYGSGHCIKQFVGGEGQDFLNQPFDHHTGLYIASGLAAMSNTVAVQQQIFVHRQQPKPVNFINTLSNSAGYFVARNLQLDGQNSFVSRGDASMEAVLQMAALDFMSGSVKQALVGVVDECVEPLGWDEIRLGGGVNPF